MRRNIRRYTKPRIRIQDEDALTNGARGGRAGGAHDDRSPVYSYLAQSSAGMRLLTSDC